MTRFAGVALSLVVLLFVSGCSAGSAASGSQATDYVAISTVSPQQPASTPTIGITPTAAVTATSQFKTFGDGTFAVGKDIAAGTYRTRTAADGCYWERLKGFTGELGDIIANDNAHGPTVVTIAASDKGFTSHRCGEWTTDLSAITTPGSPLPDGVYIVGTDLAPGTYKSAPQAGCYWERLSGFGGTLPDILANDNTDTAAIVTIKATDKGFSSNGCADWVKQ